MTVFQKNAITSMYKKKWKKEAPQPHSLPEFSVGERGGNDLLNDDDDDNVTEEAASSSIRQPW